MEDNIRMDLSEIVINTRNWVYSAQDGDYWRPAEDVRKIKGLQERI